MKLREAYTVSEPIKTANHGEVIITLACGKASVNGTGKSVKVSVLPENLKNPLGGYTFAESTLVDIVNKSIEMDMPILARFEKKRKKGVPIETPIMELITDGNGNKSMSVAAQNVVNALVGIYDFNNQKWVLHDNAAQPEHDTPDLVNFTNSRLLDSEVNVDSFFDSPKPKPLAVNSMPNIADPDNFSKIDNLMNCYLLVRQVEKKNGYELTEDIRRTMAHKLFRVAEELQKVVKGMDAPANHKQFSFKKSVYLLVDYEDKVEPLTEEKAKAFGTWLQQAYNTLKSLIEWAQSL